MEKKKYSFESIVAVILLVAMLVVLTGQVIGRYCFNQSNSWSEESARYMFIWFILITASLASYENIHIRIDIAVNLFPKKIRPWIECLGLVIFIMYTVAVAILGGKYALNMAKMGQKSLGLNLPMVYVYAAIPICHILMGIRSVQWLIRKLKDMSEKQAQIRLGVDEEKKIKCEEEKK